MSDLKQKAVKGVVWSAIDQFASQGAAFVLGIVIARIVMPEEYGLIAMLAIFVAVAQTFIDSGFSNALIQKHDRSVVDYATVFYFSIAVGIVAYGALFFSSPYIAAFYNEPRLDSVTKVVAINLLISAFSIIPRAKLTISVDFKSQTIASVTAVLVSGTIGIVLAYKGFGVWALVVQSLVNNATNTLLLWCFSRWFPLWTFSAESFKKLFGFGSKMLLSGLLDTVFRNMYQLVIGKKFAATELGYYARANQLAEFPSMNLSRIVGRVAFPVMCAVQHDDNQLRSTLRKFIKLSVFITFPLVLGLGALAEPFVSLVLTDKWLPMVPLLQILCVAYMFYPIHGLNLTVLQAKGRSDLFLRLEFIKKGLGLIVLFATIPFGLFVMCLGLIGSALLSTPVNMYYTKKLLGVRYIEQIKWILPSFILSVIMASGVYFVTLLGISNGLMLMLGIVVAVVFYYVASSCLKLEELSELNSIVGGYLSKLKKCK